MSKNANLSSLTLSNGYSFNETFNKDTLTYTVDVPNSISSILISATKEDETATITGAGTVNLSTGLNTFNVVVTAEDTNYTKIYKVKINRAKSNNAYLSSITSTDGTITPTTFNKTTAMYYLTVPYEVENANLVGVPEDKEATVSVSGNTNLSVGVQRASILVTAENGNTNTYYVDITRQPSSNNFLSSLSATDSNGTNYIDVFNKSTLSYNITVANDVTSLDIAATAEDATTTVTGVGNKKLNVGSNTITVTSTSASSIPRYYVINVVREKNKNADLGALSVEGQTLVPDFSAGEVSYQINVDSETKEVTINATAAVSTSTVTGAGTHQLQTGVNTFNIVVTAEDTTVTKTYVIVINKAASNNKYLSSLLSDVSFTPTFDKDTIVYNATVSNLTTSINVQATAEDPTATVTGTGDYNLIVGNNSILITVTAEDNTFRVYTLNIYREPSTNNYLSDLKVDNQTISDFNREKTKYTLHVTNDVTQLSIEGIAEDEESAVAGNKTWYLETGLNQADIIVTAQSGATKVYTIEVTRDKSSNNNLAILSALEGALSPSFDKDTTQYTMDVPYEITSLTLTTALEDANSKIEIEGNVDFQIGDSNLVSISVTAEDKTVKTYQIKVNRLRQANNFLSDLTITAENGKTYNLDPSFNKNTLNYTVTVEPEDTELTIVGSKEADSAKVTGLGKINITGFPYQHEVVVESASGVLRHYFITFNKKKSSNASLKQLTIDNGVLSPAFSETETNYSVTVPDRVDKINISALGYEGSSIIGTGVHSLNHGTNNIVISVSAEDGTTKNYTITVEREIEVSTTLNGIEITSGQLTPSFNPNITDYLAVASEGATNVVITPTITDPMATMTISIDDGEYQEVTSIDVTDLTKSSTVKIKVDGTDGSTIYSVTVVNQANEKITSDAYGHVIEDGMIKTVTPDTTPNQLKDQLDNDNEKLKIYERDGTTEFTGKKVGTGMIVKLFLNNVVIDQKVIVVLGDTDGNGDINVLDALKVVNHIIETDHLTGCYLIAADTTKDDIINVLDALKIINHIVGNERLS